MEVTDENFEELLPQIEESISTCSFLAIDCEFSGLKESDDKENYFETLEERYQEGIKNSAGKFLVVQFGLCAFFYDEDTNEYSHKAYNFYTFPRCFDRNAPNKRFWCEASSLEFLASTGFDFNKWINHGISYLTFQDEQKMKDDVVKRAALQAAMDDSPPSSSVPVPDHLKRFVSDTTAKITRFSNSSLKEIDLENLNPFQRKLIFHNIKPKFGHLFFESTFALKDEEEKKEADEKTNVDGSNLKRENSGARIIKISKLSEEEKEAKFAEKQKHHYDQIEKGVGFSKVIRMISQSNKLVVGHNMLLDVSYTVHQFVENLPDTLAEYKQLVQSSFPNVVDTKLMASTYPFRELISSSVLFDLLKSVQSSPFSLPNIVKKDDAYGYDVKDRKRHEAGFDAFITGACFLAMIQYLGTTQKPKKDRVAPDSPIVLPHVNKMFMMRMSDVPYLNISGTDLTPSRDHVFHVTCPPTATAKEVENIFKSYGGIQMYWSTDTSLFVSLNDKDQSDFVTRSLTPGKNGFRVIPFRQFEKLNAEKKRSRTYSPPNSDSNDPVSETEEIVAKKASKEKPKPGKKPVNDSQTPKRPKTDDVNQKGSAVQVVFEQPSTW